MDCNGYGSGVKYGLASMAFMVARFSLCSRYELKINEKTFLLSLNTFFLDALNVVTVKLAFKGKTKEVVGLGPSLGQAANTLMVVSRRSLIDSGVKCDSG